MHDPRRWAEARTFRWNDGESTEGYQAVEVDGEGLLWFRWSHVHGEGRVDEARQSFAGFLDGPLRPCPKPIEDQLRALALRRLDA